MKLYHATCSEVRVIRWVSSLEGGAPNKIWEGKKRPKFGAITDNFRL